MMDARTSAADQVADAVRAHAVDLLRFDAHLRDKVVAILRGAERELVSRLVESDIGDELTPATRARLDAVLANVRATIATAYGQADHITTTALRDLAPAEAEFVQRTTARAAGVELLTTLPSPMQLRAIASDVMVQGAGLTEWWSRQAGDMAERFKDEVRKGLVIGESNAQIVRRIRGTRANKYTDGALAITRRNAETLVRTGVAAVANQAHFETYKANADVVKGLQHLSTLDNRTSTVCVARSGLEWTLEGKPIGHDVKFAVPPLHPNCRSVLVPVLKSWKDLGIDLPEVPAGTRASMDGQVAADMTFDAFLKAKPASFQNDLLGKGVADLWRRGQITLPELIDAQSGRPLTLEQLKARARRG